MGNKPVDEMQYEGTQDNAEHGNPWTAQIDGGNDQTEGSSSQHPPAENPSMTSSNRSEIRLVNSTGMAPAPVAKPAAKLAMDPSQMISASMELHANQS